MIVSCISILLCTIAGFVIGIARLSPNWLLAKLATAYVETIRNIPLLLQIFFWYFGVLRNLPAPRDSFSFLHIIFLNNRGLYIPKPQLAEGHSFLLHWDVPILQGFNFKGGIDVIPEFVALVVGLSLYTAAFVAEAVRSGLMSVPKGQSEAAQTLGLKPGTIYRRIIIPQAMKVIIPQLSIQYLNVLKNSSIGTAIAYPDLMNVFAGTVLNQTGQAVEVVLITIAVYLTISLAISLFMGWYNRLVR